MNIKTTLTLVAFSTCLINCVSKKETDLNQNKNRPYISKVWVSDNGDGTYKNPIIHADYSDPDVVKVGDDYYMTASSFTCVPGLPILHSKDLVNWEIIGHALPVQQPEEHFSIPRHGQGVWAPCFRYHDGEFYIYYGDPDFGIMVLKAKNAAGPWSEPICVQPGKGLIDPSPLWDDDGNVYLVHAFARSRSGIKSILVVNKMNKEGTKVLDKGTIVFDGHDGHSTIEGPKFYKNNGYYYIFAPAGGVEFGWQLVLRSKNIYGPYQLKKVLAQGNTEINGPHQGAWVTTNSGEDWFIHFQDKGPFGRIVHLQPMKWVEGWPVMGNDEDGDGTGEPVLTYKKPNVGQTYPVQTPVESDEFNCNKIGLQWQWHGNPKINWAFPAPAYGVLRLMCIQNPDDAINFSDFPYLLLQKFPAPNFTASAKVKFSAFEIGEKTGLIVHGYNYSYISVKKTDKGLVVSQTICKNSNKGGKEIESVQIPIDTNDFYLRVKITEDGLCKFSYSINNETYNEVGEPFESREGGWIGAKVGIFAVRDGARHESGFADFDWFRIE